MIPTYERLNWPAYDGQDDNGLTADAKDKSELTPDCAGIYRDSKEDSYSRALERTLEKKLGSIAILEQNEAHLRTILMAWHARYSKLSDTVDQQVEEAYQWGKKDGYARFRLLLWSVPITAAVAFGAGFWFCGWMQ